ncbi:hypothetical protein D3C78_1457190 [compost metagenome]
MPFVMIGEREAEGDADENALAVSCFSAAAVATGVNCALADSLLSTSVDGALVLPRVEPSPFSAASRLTPG